MRRMLEGVLTGCVLLASACAARVSGGGGAATGGTGAALGTGGDAGGAAGGRTMDDQSGVAGQHENTDSVGGGGANGVAGAPTGANVGGTPSSMDASVDDPPDAARGGHTSADASTTWCHSFTHSFCADFDGDSYTADWSEQIVTGLGQISKTTADFKSAPGAFLSAITSDVVAPQARLRKLFPPRPTSVNLEFDLLLQDPRSESDPGQQPVEIFSIMQEGPQYSTGIRLLKGRMNSPAYLVYQRNGGNSSFTMTGPGIPTGRWVHVAFNFLPPGISGQGPSGSVILTADGAILASYHNVIDVDYYAAASTATVLSVGLSTIGNQALVMSAVYDNVTLDLVP